jgi:general L-amino acid transport system permease protein
MEQQASAAISMPAGKRNSSSALNDPVVRGIVYQVLTVVLIVGFFAWVAINTAHHLAANGQSLGFNFLEGRAGFNLAQSLIAYSSDSTYGHAFLVGILNTLLVSVVGIIIATIVGFIVGIGRLSSNWLIAKLAQVYVEIFRNIPPLLVIFFWYLGVLQVLPQPRDSLHMPFSIFLNNRGLAFPAPIFGFGMWFVLAAFVIAIVVAFVLSGWSRRRQAATGKQFPIISANIGLIILLPLLVFLASGLPLSFDYPVAGKFNLTGGAVIGPEFISLLLALSFYTASFIAEIVRGAIRAVPKGQTEAAGALGLHPSKVTRLVVIPQALRIIIPPLTSQYLNLTKNSSLAIAVGYADIFAVSTTILNQTGKAIEVVVIMGVIYLIVSIGTALFMNWFNAKMALVER